MRDFDLNLLPIVVALYEERSVTLAAKKLGMSQPALSEVLGRLRKLLDDELFIKTGHGMVPTPRAHTLVAVARDSLTRLKQELLAGKTFNPAASKTTFTFALTEVQELVFFPKIMKILQLLAPHIHSRTINPPARYSADWKMGKLTWLSVYSRNSRNIAFSSRDYSFMARYA